MADHPAERLARFTSGGLALAAAVGGGVLLSSVDFGCDPPRVAAALLLTLPLALVLAPRDAGWGGRALAALGAGLVVTCVVSLLLALNFPSHACSCWRRETDAPIQRLLALPGGLFGVLALAAASSLPILALRGSTAVWAGVAGAGGGLALSLPLMVGEGSRDALVVGLGVAVGTASGLLSARLGSWRPSPTPSKQLVSALALWVWWALVLAACVCALVLAFGHDARTPASNRDLERRLATLADRLQAHRKQHGSYPAALASVEGLDPDLVGGLMGDRLVLYGTHDDGALCLVAVDAVGGKAEGRPNRRLRLSPDGVTLVRSSSLLTTWPR